jgi:hypothetical protein
LVGFTVETFTTVKSVGADEGLVKGSLSVLDVFVLTRGAPGELRQFQEKEITTLNISSLGRLTPCWSVESRYDGFGCIESVWRAAGEGLQTAFHPRRPTGDKLPGVPLPSSSSSPHDESGHAEESEGTLKDWSI